MYARRARRARRARVARRPPRAAPSLSTEGRPKRRRETRTTTGDGTRVASREGQGRFMCETRRGGAFTICHRRTLRRALSADLPRQRVSMIHRAVLALDCTTLAPTTRTNALSLRNMAVTKSITNDEQHFIITNLTFTTLSKRCPRDDYPPRCRSLSASFWARKENA